MHKGDLTFVDLATLVAAARMRRKMYVAVVCPLCGPHCRKKYNRRRKCLWINHTSGDEGFYSYKCHRCEAHGWAKDDGGCSKLSIRRQKPSEAEPDNSKLAAELWERAVPLPDTPAQLYLRSRQCDIESSNIRFLKARGKYHNAMIARFSSKDGSTKGVHLTRINLDGSKADVETAKIMLGPSAGWPIIISNGGDTLCIAEGIEDAASMSLALAGPQHGRLDQRVG